MIATSNKTISYNRFASLSLVSIFCFSKEIRAIQLFLRCVIEEFKVFFGYGFAAKARFGRTLAVSEGAGRASAPPPMFHLVYLGTQPKIQQNVDSPKRPYRFL
jgi:hypothetical protein